MKKTLKRMMSVLLCTLLALSAVSFTISVTAQNDGNTVYISDGGSDSRDGKTPETAVQTLKRAFEIGGTNPTVVVTDYFTHGGEVAACTLTGLTPESVLNVKGWVLRLKGDVTFKNLTLNATTNYSFIIAQGHTLLVDENITLTANEGIKPLLCIRGGGDGNVIAGDTNVIIKSGDWPAVHGGTRNANVEGSTYITIYDTANVGTVRGGNDSSAGDTNGVLGNAIIKLVGSKPGATTFGKCSDIRGTTYLDLTEYTGTVTDSMKALGAVTITKKEDLANIKTEIKKEDLPPEPVVPEVVYDVPEGVIYLSDNGTDTNDGKTPEKPVKTLSKALVLGGTNPTIAVTDSYTHASGNVAACTIIGINADSTFNVKGWSLTLAGDVTVRNIKLNAMSAWSFILCRGNNFTADEGVVNTTAEGISQVLSIRGGGEGNSVEGDTNIVLKSGSWKSVFGGTKGADVAGNTYVTVYEGAQIETLSGGNDAANDTNKIMGNAVLKFVGASTAVKNITKSKDVAGTIYLDLTEYTGSQTAAMQALGATVIATEADLPEFIKERNKVMAGVYDLPTDTELIFLSDSGDDANDGKSKDKPKKTLNAAQEALGEAGGTVVITGTYTHNGNKTPAGSVSFTSTCKDDRFVWNNWSLLTNNTTFSNITILVSKDWAFFLHGGTPLVIGDNVTIENAPGIKNGLGIRAGEKGDYAMTDITIKSGYIRHIFTGTKNGNILGDSKVTILGGQVDGISVGNDSTDGRTLGNTIITVKGAPKLTSITDKKQYDGYVILDFTEYKTPTATTVSGALRAITNPEEMVIPINANVIYINGYPDGTFLPDKVMTRAEAITVVSKLCGLTEGTILPEASGFSDVTDADWYARNVKYLEKNGMTDFFGDTLSANEGITRAEFVKLIAPVIIKKDGDNPSFSDVPETHKFYNEIILAAKAGLVNGYPDGTFLPENTLKRAEIVTILNRLARRNIVEANIGSVNSFSDIDGHWARDQIIVASCESKNENGLMVWYSGDKYSENTPFDYEALETPLVDKVLEGVDTEDSAAVMTAVEAYAAKRREEIKNTPTSVEVTGTKYYVSNSGSNANDGKTPESAWQTLDKVNSASLKEGDGVFFKRGDTFRGQLTTKKGVTYSAYGEGAKPNLYGSLRNYSESAFWDKSATENVYISKEIFSKDVGLIVFNHGEEWSIKQIDGKKDFNGTLDEDLELYHNKDNQRL